MKDLDYRYILANARADSVNNSQEQAKKRKKLVLKREVEFEEEKLNAIIGVVNKMISSSLDLLAINEVNKEFNKYTNASYDKGFEIISDIEEQSEGAINFESIANAYTSETDFYSYVFGIFSKIYMLDKKMALIKMNNVFYWLSLYGYTNFATFEDYCISKGYFTEEKGNKKIDIALYRNGMTLYLKELKDKEGK